MQGSQSIDVSAAICGTSVSDERAGMTQIDLFSWVAVPADEVDDGPDTDPLVLLPVVQRVVRAADCAPLLTNAASSVFALAACNSARGLVAKARIDRRKKNEHRPLYRVQQEAGVIRCERILPQETDEWAQQEAARRARQKPPKPTKAAKTKGTKLLELIGGGNG